MGGLSPTRSKGGQPFKNFSPSLGAYRGNTHSQSIETARASPKVLAMGSASDPELDSPLNAKVLLGKTSKTLSSPLKMHWW